MLAQIRGGAGDNKELSVEPGSGNIQRSRHHSTAVGLADSAQRTGNPGHSGFSRHNHRLAGHLAGVSGEPQRVRAVGRRVPLPHLSGARGKMAAVPDAPQHSTVRGRVRARRLLPEFRGQRGPWQAGGCLRGSPGPHQFRRSSIRSHRLHRVSAHDRLLDRFVSVLAGLLDHSVGPGPLLSAKACGPGGRN